MIHDLILFSSALPAAAAVAAEQCGASNTGKILILVVGHGTKPRLTFHHQLLSLPFDCQT